MDGVQLYFGWRVAILGLCSLQILALGLAIALQPANAKANRLLTGVLLALAGAITPYTIGFAGAYDAWRWLTFAPFSLPLAVPPLLFGYAHALVTGRMPDRFGMHLAVPGLQLGYFLICFALPLDAKWAWYTGVHEDLVSPAFKLALLGSLGGYAVMTLRLLAVYRRDLADVRSDDDRFATAWLARVVVALVLVLAAYSVFALWDWLSGGIDYFQETGLYLSLAAIGLYLGVEGLRRAALRFPTVVFAAPVDVSPGPDWSTLAAQFDARVRAEEWACEPDLSLPVMARRLGTNTGRLSRAINQGLGLNFSIWINGIRAETVAAALRQGSTDDLLTLAFDAGFSSKASFNRAFRTRYGVAPSRYRRGGSDRDYVRPEADVRRADVEVSPG